MNQQFFDDLRRVENASAELPPEIRAKLARGFRTSSQTEKEVARDILFRDLVTGAEALGAIIGQMKSLLLIPEGFQAMPINGHLVEARLREVHDRLVDAAQVLTDAGGLLYPEAPATEVGCIGTVGNVGCDSKV